MESFEEKLNSLLNSPESMNQLMQAAQAFMGTSSAPDPSPAPPQTPTSNFSMPSLPDPATLQKISRYMSVFSQSDTKSSALLEAIKPYLKPERAAKIDSVIRISGLIKVAKLAMSEQNGGGFNL